MMRAAVIGTGHIARQHLACLKTIEGVQLDAVCDLSPAMAESAAERFDVPKWFTNHREMLDRVKPDVVHITTPARSHFRLAMDAIESGAHVLVEKPAAITYDEVLQLQASGGAKSRAVVEDHNYLFNKSVLRLLDLIRTGQFGEVMHVDVTLCLNIRSRGSRFVDVDAPHPSVTLPGGAISDFLTHLSYLSYAFVGPHRRVSTTWRKYDAATPLPSDEFCALVDAERGTAKLAFSAHSQPDVFLLQVFGTKMRGTANLFEPRLTLERLYDGPRPLLPVLNGMRESFDVSRAAVGGLFRKLSGGPGAYEGVWELIRRMYQALRLNGALPVPAMQVEWVNRLVSDLTQKEYRL